MKHWLNGTDLTTQYILPSLLLIHEAQLERTQNSVSHINVFPSLNNLDIRSYKSDLKKTNRGLLHADGELMP